jgi:hypothetical protein
MEGSILRMQALMKVYSELAILGIRGSEVSELKVKKAALIKREALEESLELKSILSRFLKKERM